MKTTPIRAAALLVPVKTLKNYPRHMQKTAQKLARIGLVADTRAAKANTVVES